MSANLTTAADEFAAERPRLFGIAYRMLGSRADAEDVLQDAWLRWRESETEELRSTQAWLTTIVTRLAIDRLRSAKARREVYVGPWLPEPLAEVDFATPESKAEIVSDLSIAFLNLLERLGPEERAAFVLHDVFECDYDDIAEVLNKSEAACRQLVHRARDRVTAERKRFQVDEPTRLRMLERFINAANHGDLAALKSMFAPDAQLISDGGGKALAVRRILYGAERITRLWYALLRRNLKPERRIVRINGELGLETRYRGNLHSVTTIDTDGEYIHTYYTVANPDKLNDFQIQK
jgi:RNA polymerase sigma-70 factor (ECF subfamily)